MKQRVVSEALEIIGTRHTENEIKAKQNMLDALQIPQFRAAYEKFSEAKISKAKSLAFDLNDTSNFENCKKNLENVMKNFKISGIFPKYSCKKCDDTGFVNGKYCDCLKKEITLLLLKQSGFQKLESFDKTDFSIFDNKEQTKKIYSLMQKWCLSPTQKTTIFLCGHAGTGKTYLTKCMANELIHHGVITQIVSAFALNQKFLSIHIAKEQEKNTLIQEIMDVEALIIDDLGTEPILNNVTKQYLELIINERQMKGLRTVITSNLYPDDIMTRYDERIFSRLMDKEKAIVLEMNGKDLRLKK